MRGRHIPMRRCVGCGQRAPKDEMLRICAEDDGRLVVSQLGAGRGAYLHRSAACWEKFAGRKGVVASLRRNVDRSAREILVQGLRESAKKNKFEA